MKSSDCSKYQNLSRNSLIYIEMVCGMWYVVCGTFYFVVSDVV